MKAIKLLALMLVAILGLTACHDDDKDGHFYQWTYTGKNTVKVGSIEFEPVPMTCKVTKKDNGTLDVEMPEYQISGNPIGSLTIGAVTIKDIAYNPEKEAYYRMFGKDKLKISLQSDGMMKLNGPYDFTEDSDIEVKQTDNGATIVLDYSFENMGMRVTSTFEVVVPK